MRGVLKAEKYNHFEICIKFDSLDIILAKTVNFAFTKNIKLKIR